MNMARYFLHRSGGVWLVTLEGRIMGRYASRTEATEAAIVMADLMGKMRYEADVAIESEPGGVLELIWTHGGSTGRRPLPRRIVEPVKPRRHVRLLQRGQAA
jgi:hypothetical protein